MGKPPKERGSLKRIFWWETGQFPWLSPSFAKVRRVVAKIPWNGSVVLLQMSSMLLSSMTRAGRACEKIVVLVLPLWTNFISLKKHKGYKSHPWRRERPNVISIGDSVYEQAALASATKCSLARTTFDSEPKHVPWANQAIRALQTGVVPSQSWGMPNCCSKTLKLLEPQIALVLLLFCLITYSTAPPSMKRGSSSL